MQAFWMALLVRAIKALAGAVVWEAALEQTPMPCHYDGDGR